MQKKRKIVFFCPNQNHVTICDGLFTPLLGEPHAALQPPSNHSNHFFSSIKPHLDTTAPPVHSPPLVQLSFSCVVKTTRFLTTMRVSVLTEEGELHHLEFDSQMEVENIKALIEADVKIKDISCFVDVIACTPYAFIVYLTITIITLLLCFVVWRSCRGPTNLPQRTRAC